MAASWARINTLLLVLLLAAVTGLIAMFATRSEGGPLDPPGAPAPTLPQVESRSPIPPVGWNGTFPIVISQPGSYFLTRPLTGVADTDGIQITYGDVNLDLNGFTLSGANKTGAGIRIVGFMSNVRISNGVVRDWNNGIDGWSGGNEAIFSRVDNVTALYNQSHGILLGFDSEILNCNVSQNNVGVKTHFSVVRWCHATDNFIGIRGEDRSVIEYNRAFNNTLGINVAGIATQGHSVVRWNASIQNSGTDLELSGFENVADGNTVTCPAKVSATISSVQYDTRYQRNPC